MRIKLPFDVISVKRDCMSESFHTADRSNGLRVYIGRQNYHFPEGEYTYAITYTTKFQPSLLVSWTRSQPGIVGGLCWPPEQFVG